jgi:hypothetical protein
MTESSTALDCLQGLEELLIWQDDSVLASYLHTVASIHYAADPLQVLKKLTVTSAPLGVDILNKHLNCYINLVQQRWDIGEIISCARDFGKNKLLNSILNFEKTHSDLSQLNAAFSRSQIRSKIWLVEELARIQPHWSQVAVFAGWYGQLAQVFKQQLSLDKMRVIDLDRGDCAASDYIFNIEDLTDYQIKAVCANINGLTLYKNGYEWSVENFKDGGDYSEKFLPDLIINTSAEHMTEEWFHQLRFKQLDSDPIVAIQSNNLFDLAEHVNCVHSVDHMIKKFPMREVLFAGELQLKGYKRVMLIGRP